MKYVYLLTVSVAALASMTIGGRAQDFPALVATPASAKFVRLPFLPSCMTVAMVQGDPRSGPSIELARIAPGCFIPRHWHTANTRLIFISGRGTHELGNRTPKALQAGDYVYLPARVVHSFRCTSGCLVYNLQDARDIVHWIDLRGRPISPKQAFTHHP
ncbi:MAG: cupin domain-containing protein [Candidatus Baltobacteraceae bacterium]